VPPLPDYDENTTDDECAEIAARRSALLIEYEKLSTVPQIVMDPFSGSGTVCVVAKRHDRRAVGIELSYEYCDLARRRIRGLGVVERVKTAQMEMF
jgi:DNA modification methylase